MMMSDVDTSPIFLLKENKKENNTESDFQLSEDLQEQIKNESDFSEIIEKTINLETRKHYKEAMKNSQCFIRMWQDPDSKEFCELMDCELSTECEFNWNLIKNKNVNKVECFESELKQRKYLTKGSKGKHKDSYKFSRTPYVDLGRPIDLIAAEIYNLFGEPKNLSIDFRYPSIQKYPDMDTSKVFIDLYGSDICVSKKYRNHTYFVEGKHLCRLWVNSAGCGWLDIDVRLYEHFKICGVSGLKPVQDTRMYKYFSHKLLIESEGDIQFLIKTFSKWEYLNKFIKFKEEEE